MSVRPSVKSVCQVRLSCPDNVSRTAKEVETPNFAQICSLCVDRTLLNSFWITLPKKFFFKLETTFFCKPNYRLVCFGRNKRAHFGLLDKFLVKLFVIVLQFRFFLKRARLS